MINHRIVEPPRAAARSSVLISQPVEGRLRTPAGLRHLLETAARTTNGIVFVQSDDSDRVVPYADVLARASARLQELRANGLYAGDRVVLLVGDNEQFVISFWACVLGGIIPAPLVCPPSFAVVSDPLRKMEAVWRHMGCPIIMGDPSLAAALRTLGDGLVGARVLIPGIEQRSFAPAEAVNPETLDTTAFIQFSSGSTGQPKGVVLSHLNLLTNIEAMSDGLRVTPADRFLSWMPYFHDMGLIGLHLFPVAAANTQINMSPMKFVKQPVLWLRKAQQHGATITASPNFGYQRVLEKLTDEDVGSLDLSSVRVIVNGAEPISCKLMRSFEDRLAPAGLKPHVVLPVYGMAEASLGVTFPAPGTPAVTRVVDRPALARHGRVTLAAPGDSSTLELADEGMALGSTDVRVVDETDTVLEEGRVGHIQIRGDNVTRGYFENPAANRATFCEGWLRTGDMGFVCDGRLTVTGRSKDIIFVNGQNYFAFDVEECAAEVEGVIDRRVVVVGWHDAASGTERVAMFIGVKSQLPSGRSREDVYRDVWLRVAQTVGVQVDVMVPLRTVPKTTSGKVQRYRLLEEMLGGAFDDVRVRREDLFATGPAHAEVNVTPTQETVRHAFADVLGRQAVEVPLDAAFLSLGGSSLKAMDLLSRLERVFDMPLPQRMLVECRTTRDVARFIDDARAEPAVRQAVHRPAADTGGEIAIIGIGARFPGAADADGFWTMLRDGRGAVGEVPADRFPIDRYYREGAGAPGTTNCKWGAYLDDPYAFDHSFFQVSAEDAAGIDPQQRLFLEVAYRALEQAGHAGRRSRGKPIGVFAGAGHSAHFEYQLHGLAFQQFQVSPAYQALSESQRGELAGAWEELFGRAEVRPNTVADNLLNMIAARTSHLLDLRGPSLTVDTACSASLVAVHLACESLRRGECEMAVAGGVNVLLTPTPYLLFTQAGALSRSGACRTFDADADGFVPGEGAGAVALKPLAAARRDGDHVLAVIRASAINNDGSALGVMTPNPDGQREVVRAVYQRCGVSPREVSYVEAHGTGTAIGDPIEVRALAQAFGEFTDDRQFCAIGSVKSNVGHLLGAAGIAGLVKVVSALQHAWLPPTLNVARLNPRIEFERTPFHVLTSSSSWRREPGKLLRAGINSFGFGGTNCHMLIEENLP
jgi:acyl-CoA synthetase (AMP-forming)/AMP-acid ligase II/3-oxoacyl-(acyl-carrier-protein) synthase/acyl carrier protein